MKTLKLLSKAQLSKSSKKMTMTTVSLREVLRRPTLKTKKNRLKVKWRKGRRKMGWKKEDCKSTKVWQKRRESIRWRKRRERSERTKYQKKSKEKWPKEIEYSHCHHIYHWFIWIESRQNIKNGITIRFPIHWVYCFARFVDLVVPSLGFGVVVGSIGWAVEGFGAILGCFVGRWILWRPCRECWKSWGFVGLVVVGIVAVVVVGRRAERQWQVQEGCC